MKKEQCSKCDSLARVERGEFRFDDMGLPVVLQRIELVKCENCGNVDPLIPNMDGLMHALALAVICQPCKLNGEELHFLRKYLGKSGKEFAGLLHVHNTHLSKLENGSAKIGDQTDKYVRLLVLNLSPELKGDIDKLSIEIDLPTMETQYA
jgi:DNA-binding transcriptional regulator YiaG